MATQRKALARAGVDARDIYEDAASGAIENRPQLQAMLKDLGAGDTLVVVSLDRLSRIAMQVQQLVMLIRQKGARLRVLNMPFVDHERPTGALLVQIISAIAEFERAQSREKTIDGLRRAREEGRMGGRRSAVTDRQVIAASAQGTAAAMRALRFKSKAGYLKRLAQARARELEEQE